MSVTGYFILSVRIAGATNFGVLESGSTAHRLKYDDAARTKAARRPAVLELVTLARANWQSNYRQYADAEFRVEEFDNQTGELKVVSGTPYPARTDVRQRVVEFAKAYDTHARKASFPAMVNFLMIGTEDFPEWAGFSEKERRSICQEVAAGHFTPAMV